MQEFLKRISKKREINRKLLEAKDQIQEPCRELG